MSDEREKQSLKNAPINYNSGNSPPEEMFQIRRKFSLATTLDHNEEIFIPPHFNPGNAFDSQASTDLLPLLLLRLVWCRKVFEVLNLNYNRVIKILLNLCNKLLTEPCKGNYPEVSDPIRRGRNDWNGRWSVRNEIMKM